jgi:hypothetical protein
VYALAFILTSLISLIFNLLIFLAYSFVTLFLCAFPSVYRCFTGFGLQVYVRFADVIIICRNAKLLSILRDSFVFLCCEEFTS